MNEAVKLLLSLSLSGSILAVLIFAVKPFIKHKISKSIQYYIWIVVILRLTLPFSLETSIMNELFYGNQAAVVETSQVEVQPAVQPMVGTAQNIPNSNSVLSVQENVANGVYNGDADHGRYFQDLFNQYTIYIWMLGVIIALTVNLTGYAKFLKHLKQTNTLAVNMEKEMLITLLNGRNNVRLVRNRFLNTPMLIGVIRPCIIIPDIKFNEIQLKNILLHEIIHLKRFDIGVKWLTMIVSSIHWFNPLMYFIKKDINSSCELACDEAVIKNLSPAEKQDYGDTLISVVAHNKYPTGILQVTMLDEKRGLKERLVAIMNHSRKSKKVIILSVILLGGLIFGALYLGAGVGAVKNAPPDIYINVVDQEVKVALMGTYSWKYNGENIEADSDDPKNFNYKLENATSIKPSQEFVIGTQKLKNDKQYDLSIEEISIYKDGKSIKLYKPVPPSFVQGGDLGMTALKDAGEYIYTIKINFKDRGTVSYGFVVKVGMPAYDLIGISKYKTPYLGDNSKVSIIVNALPEPYTYFKQQYISMVTEKKPYKLNVFYEAKKYASHISEWPIVDHNNVIYSNMSRNALVLFCMIDNLDEVTFAFRDSQSDGKLDDSKYDTTFTFTRASIEKQYGDISVLAGKVDLLRDALSKDPNAKQTPKNDQIEKYIEIIMSSPNTSSSPNDYIKAHQNEYQNIVKMGDESLNYLLAQFEKRSNNNDLKGSIMMRLCKELLGDRNNVTDESLSPQEWYSKQSH
ncbi:M56 family metallopeptidase [Clostridium sp.]|jgi:beta-lactamase regulating signal transducer with metallopeptidase domain|uniref:M56 family metallopeptidase n=1 Tax=Clostridium sp. TaxID=1506 RepID=UPI003EECE992